MCIYNFTCYVTGFLFLQILGLQNRKLLAAQKSIHVYCLKTIYLFIYFIFYFFNMMFPFAGEVVVVYVVCFLRWGGGGGGVDFSKATFLCGGHIAFLFDLSVYVSENVVLHSNGFD